MLPLLQAAQDPPQSVSVSEPSRRPSAQSGRRQTLTMAASVPASETPASAGPSSPVAAAAAESRSAPSPAASLDPSAAPSPRGALSDAAGTSCEASETEAS